MYRYSLIAILALGIAGFTNDASGQCVKQCRAELLNCKGACINKFGRYAAPETGMKACQESCEKTAEDCEKKCQVQECIKECGNTVINCKQGCINKFGLYAAPETGMKACQESCEGAHKPCVAKCNQ